MPGVDVQLIRTLTGLSRRTVTGPDGAFEWANLPPDRYDLRAEISGFEPQLAPVVVRTSVPLTLTIVLRVATQSTTVLVTPAPQLVDPTITGTRTQVSFVGIDQLPAPVGSRGVESVLVTLPGFAQNANGAIHPRGAHNQMTYVVDGLPISDQLTGAFANALDGGLVQAAELWTGNIPAEFGAKVSGVVVITSRSGIGSNRWFDRRRLGGSLGVRHLARLRPGRRAARADWLLRFGDLDAHRSLPRSGIAGQPAQRRWLRPRIPSRRRPPLELADAPRASDGWRVAIRHRQPPLAASERPGPGPASRRSGGMGRVHRDYRQRRHHRVDRRPPRHDVGPDAERGRHAGYRDAGPHPGDDHRDGALYPVAWTAQRQSGRGRAPFRRWRTVRDGPHQPGLQRPWRSELQRRARAVRSRPAAGDPFLFDDRRDGRHLGRSRRPSCSSAPSP